MNFQISDKVVCVDDSLNSMATEFHNPNGHVVKGEIYVVTGLDDGENGEGLFLVGKPTMWRDIETSWRMARFRRLEDIKALAKISKRTGIPIE